MDAFSAWLLQLVKIGGPTLAVVYALFRSLGKTLIDQRLTLQLESFKNERQKELETHKSEQQGKLEVFKAEQQRDLEHLRQFLSGRVSKIHEKEFEILPKAWFMLQDAWGMATYAVDGRLMYPPALDHVSDEELEQFLSEDPGKRLSPLQKESLRKSSDKQKYFIEAMAGIYSDDAFEKHRIFNNFLLENFIFMTENLYEKFRAVAVDLADGVHEYRLGKRANKWEMQRSGMDKVMHLQTKVDQVAKAIQDRLHYGEA